MGFLVGSHRFKNWLVSLDVVPADFVNRDVRVLFGNPLYKVIDPGHVMIPAFHLAGVFQPILVFRGSTVDVPVGVAHRIENLGVEELVFIEVQHGDYFGEDDIIRLEDDFGRVSTSRTA